MAQCGREYTFACRFAARGNNKVIPDSRARGEDGFSTHRFAARGSDGIYADSRDLKIKRLQQRVCDLEIQQDIKRLRQRIRDLELKSVTHQAETESSTIVWDEGDDGEEYPFSRHPPLFYKPVYWECLPEEKPRFDEDGRDDVLLPNKEPRYDNCRNKDFIYESPPVFHYYGDEEDDVRQESEPLEPRDEGVEDSGSPVMIGDLMAEICHVSPVFDEYEDEEKVSLDSGDDALGVEVITRGNVNVDGVHVMGSESYGIQIQKIDIIPLKVVDNSKLYGHARVEDVTINKDDYLSMDENEFKSAPPFGDMNFNKGEDDINQFLMQAGAHLDENYFKLQKQILWKRFYLHNPYIFATAKVGDRITFQFRKNNEPQEATILAQNIPFDPGGSLF